MEIDNKLLALATRLAALAEGLGNSNSSAEQQAADLAREAKELINALSPQADKARGEVYCYPAWAHGECLEVLRNVDTQFRVTGQASARIERLINLLAGITPQPQGDVSPQDREAFCTKTDIVSGAHTLVPGDGDDALEALSEIAAGLNCPCTMDDIEEAIEALRRGTTPQVSGGGEVLNRPRRLIYEQDGKDYVGKDGPFRRPFGI